MPTTRLEDVIVPEIFTKYVLNKTKEKCDLIQSGAAVWSDELAALLQGGGRTFNHPFWPDLDGSDEENISSDDPNQLATPSKISADAEIQVRLSRNKSWSTMDLAGQLAGSDPMAAIVDRVAYYWSRRLQRATLAALNGVFANNAQAPIANEHVQNDMMFDISGTAYQAGVTTFSGGNFINATLTMGDQLESIKLIAVHSIVYGEMLKQNLIEVVADSNNPAAEKISTYLGRRIIVDDMLSPSAGVYDTYLFGEGAIGLAMAGVRSPGVPTEIARNQAAGNGSGETVLHSRMDMITHPVGYKYVGDSPNPSNANTTGNLAHADSWRRAFVERKQIPIARLRTREHA